MTELFTAKAVPPILDGASRYEPREPGAKRFEGHDLVGGDALQLLRVLVN